MTDQEKIDRLYNQLFSKRISGNDNKFTDWEQLFPINHQMKDQITQLIKKGYKVSTGYTATTIRGYHTYHIFFKETSKT